VTSNNWTWSYSTRCPSYSFCEYDQNCCTIWKSATFSAVSAMTKLGNWKQWTFLIRNLKNKLQIYESHMVRFRYVMIHHNLSLFVISGLVRSSVVSVVNLW